MPVIELQTRIDAPVERVFDLARNIDLHMDSAGATGERAVAGVTSGLIGLGDTVTWRARHFGVWQHLGVRIVAFDRPRFFRDEMLTGAFRSMAHDHLFEASDDGERTTMRDVFRFEAPLGPLGRVAESLFLTRYMQAFLIERNRVIKATAESEAWRRYQGP
jgi:ligand-binding SRPBCC domain-containing protein